MPRREEVSRGCDVREYEVLRRRQKVKSVSSVLSGVIEATSAVVSRVNKEKSARKRTRAARKRAPRVAELHAATRAKDHRGRNRKKRPRI